MQFLEVATLLDSNVKFETGVKKSQGVKETVKYDAFKKQLNRNCP